MSLTDNLNIKYLSVRLHIHISPQRRDIIMNICATFQQEMWSRLQFLCPPLIEGSSPLLHIVLNAASLIDIYELLLCYCTAHWIAEDIHIVLPLSENILPQGKINASRSIFRAADFKTVLLNSAADVKQIKPSREARGTPCYLKKHVTGSGGPGDTLNPQLRHPMRM